MDYELIYDFCVWANEAWKGCFTAREIAKNAHDICVDPDLLKSSIEQLREDGSEEATEWLDKLGKEV